MNRIQALAISFARLDICGLALLSLHPGRESADTGACASKPAAAAPEQSVCAASRRRLCLPA